MAAQSESLRTNTINADIDRPQNDSLRRMCLQKNETLNHLRESGPKWPLKEYKQKRDGVVRAVHRDLCKQHYFERSEKW